MSRRPERDPHARFEAWLLAGGATDLPRDVALHASVCPGCGSSIAAFDALAAIDPGRAMPPPSRGIHGARNDARGVAWVRMLVPVGGVVTAGVLVAVGIAQVAPGAPGGLGSDPSTTQDVLGATGRPDATSPDATGLFGGELSQSPKPSPAGTFPTATSSAQPTQPGTDPSVGPTAVPTARPTGTQTSAPTATASPSVGPTATGSPSVAPTATASPSPSSTPAATPTPSPTPTSAPTPTPTPQPTPTPEPTPSP
jgi:hypothetical protein